MTKALVIHSFGSPEVLKTERVDPKIVNETDMIIRHTAIGLNSYDIRQRRGDFNFNVPLTIGCEAVGVVEKVGASVKFFAPGARVAYATSPFGSCAESQVINENYVVPVPDIIKDKEVAAILHKAMSAHYLLRRTFFVSEKSTILVVNGAKDIGSFLVKLGRHYHTKIIATVNNAEEKELIKDFAHHIIDSSKENVVESVKDFTKGQMVNVVYDPCGIGSFDSSIDCLMPLGLFVGYDAIKGKINSIDVKKLYKKCHFVTFSNLFAYKANRAELLLSANEVFALFQQKVVLPNITKEYTLDEVKKAHEDYEADRIKGQAIISI